MVLELFLGLLNELKFEQLHDSWHSCGRLVGNYIHRYSNKHRSRLERLSNPEIIKNLLKLHKTIFKKFFFLLDLSILIENDHFTHIKRNKLFLHYYTFIRWFWKTTLNLLNFDINKLKSNLTFKNLHLPLKVSEAHVKSLDLTCPRVILHYWIFKINNIALNKHFILCW